MDEKQRYQELLEKKRYLELQAKMNSQYEDAAAQVPEKSTFQKAKEFTANGLHGVANVFGYPVGHVTNAIAQSSDLKNRLEAKLNGEEVDPSHLITREGDTMRAIKGNAPSMIEYETRAGLLDYLKKKNWDDGGHLGNLLNFAPEGTAGRFTPEMNGMLDITGLGTANTIASIGIDPLTHGGAALSRVARGGEAGLLPKFIANDQGLTRTGKLANVALNPMELFSRKAGDAAYRGAFSNVDQALAKIQDSPETIAQIMKQHGFVGNAQQAAEFVTDLNKRAGEEIGKILNEASNKGANVDMGAAYNKAIERANELRSTGNIPDSKVADMIEKQVESYREAQPYAQPVNKANVVKSNTNSRATHTNSSEDSLSSEAMKEVARPIGNEINKSIGAVDNDLLENLLKNNATYHSTNGEAQYIMDSWAGKAPQMRNAGTPTKVDLLALGLKPTMVLGKKAGDIALSTRGRTATGFALDRLGQNSSGMMDEANRQLWIKMLQENNNEQK